MQPYPIPPAGFDPGPAPPLTHIACRACDRVMENVATILAGLVRGATPEEIQRGDGASMSAGAFCRLSGLERRELLDHAELILQVHHRGTAAR
jgi:hypothetical protein